MKFTIRTLVVALSVFCSLRVATAVTIAPGDIVTAQSDNFGTIIVVHPKTHQRETLTVLGGPPNVYRPESILQLPNRNFLVADGNGLFEISSTGNLAVRSSPTIGAGNWNEPYAVLMTSSGDLICVFYDFVSRVDLITGDRTLISGHGVGIGPNVAIQGAGGAALDQLGHVVIGSYEDRAVFHVDLATGARSILSGMGHGSGPALSYLMDVVVLPNGQIVAEGRDLDAGLNELFRIDPVTGNRTIISTHSMNDENERLALGIDGKLLGSAPYRDAVYSIDPTNGARTLISGNGLGSGPELSWGDMVQVPVPEPTSVALLAMGMAVLFAASRAQRLRRENAMARRRH